MPEASMDPVSALALVLAALVGQVGRCSSREMKAEGMVVMVQTRRGSTQVCRGLVANWVRVWEIAERYRTCE